MGTPQAPVERLRFEGLRFSYSSWLGMSRPTGYANLQSGSFLLETSPIRPADAWQSCGRGCVEFESVRQKWNQMPAAVQVSATRDVTFERNIFSQLGHIALDEAAIARTVTTDGWNVKRGPHRRSRHAGLQLAPDASPDARKAAS